jgi:hypothetical protein
MSIHPSPMLKTCISNDHKRDQGESGQMKKRKDKQKQLIKIQHRYQKSVKGKTNKNRQNCHTTMLTIKLKNILDILLCHSWVEISASSNGHSTAISFIQ